MIAIGKQFPKDKKLDKSGFLEKARWHQSKFRAEVLKVECDDYGNFLKPADALNGLNFYHDFSIFSVVRKRYPKYSKGIYANMLRSEHIGFNFFIPLKEDLEFCKNVFEEILGMKMKSIDVIEVEYAPTPASKYLNDKTSFDTYIEYTMADKSKGIIGIEVKYTERAYGLKKGSKEDVDIKDKNSRYYQIFEKSNIYKEGSLPKLITNDYRQIWRNQLLGESIIIEDSNKFQHFTSLTIFPKGNEHFVEKSNKYMDMLTNNIGRFHPIVYEDMLKICYTHCPNQRFKNWLDYLTDRYIIKN